MVWCDLANRQRPVALFRLGRSDRFQDLLGGLLRGWRALARARLRDESLAWLADVAFKLSEHGLIGLGALYPTITRPEVRRCFAETTPSGEDFGRLVRLIA